MNPQCRARCGTPYTGRMARAWNHYESALEHELLLRGAALMPVDEIRTATAAGRPHKNFDFVLYRGGGPHWLLEVKGRSLLASRSPNPWTTMEDMANLAGWQPVFGPAFEPVFAFVFEIEACRDDGHFVREGRNYQAWAMPLADVAALSHVRSRSWRTLTIPAAAFRRAARPLFEAAGLPQTLPTDSDSLLGGMNAWDAGDPLPPHGDGDAFEREFGHMVLEQAGV